MVVFLLGKCCVKISILGSDAMPTSVEHSGARRIISHVILGTYV